MSHPCKIPTRTSIGIILCRKNNTTGRPEVLLVHKRYTYAFTEFVHGRFARGKIKSSLSLRNVITNLLEQMTLEELFDIISLNFSQMWYRVWLTLDNRDFYNKKNAKFQSTFMCEDGGETLRKLVMLVHSKGTLLWSLPKGRHLNNNEANILCATRELFEETGIKKSEYHILPGAKRCVSYVSCGTRYNCIYYIAIAKSQVNKKTSIRPTLRNIGDMAEISESQWYDIENIRLIDDVKLRLETLISPAFKLMNQYIKGKWDTRKHILSVRDFDNKQLSEN